jgi:acyl carrier protein
MAFQFYELAQGTMQMSDVTNKVRQIVASHLGIAEEVIEPDTSFGQDLGADSLDIAELMIAFEDEFAVEIDRTDASNIRTVKDAVRFIQVAP